MSVFTPATLIEALKKMDPNMEIHLWDGSKYGEDSPYYVEELKTFLECNFNRCDFDSWVSCEHKSIIVLNF